MIEEFPTTTAISRFADGRSAEQRQQTESLKKEVRRPKKVEFCVTVRDCPWLRRHSEWQPVSTIFSRERWKPAYLGYALHWLAKKFVCSKLIWIELFINLFCWTRTLNSTYRPVHHEWLFCTSSHRVVLFCREEIGGLPTSLKTQTQLGKGTAVYLPIAQN